jgi:hypothetical protein
LQPLEEDYRKLTAMGNLEAVARMKVLIETVRYELRMDAEVIFEYRDGLPEPMVMRILKTEKDLDRWVESRFIRLGEFEK